MSGSRRTGRANRTQPEQGPAPEVGGAHPPAGATRSVDAGGPAGAAQPTDAGGPAGALAPSDGDAAYRQLYAFVDDLRQVIAERERALAAASDAQRAKAEFLAEATVALTEPITTISGFADVALRGATDPEQRDALVRVLRAARELEHRVQLLLTLARLDR